MRPNILFLLFFVFCTFATKAQSLIHENFKTGNFNSSNWQGDSSLFQIQNGSLKLEDSVAGQASLYHSSQIMRPGYWEFHARLDFNPSSSNYLELHLMGDHPHIDSIQFGYSLLIGGNSKDEIRLYRLNGGSRELILSSPEDYLDLDPLEIHLRVERDSNFRWQLFADTGTFQQWNLLGQVSDSSHRYSALSGFSAHYTKTRSDRFYIDSLRFEGAIEPDFEAPKLLSWQLDSTRLSFHFNEKLARPDSQVYLQIEPHLPQANWQWQAESPDQLIWQLDSLPKPNQYYQIYLSGIADLFGNRQSDSLILLKRVLNTGELSINEIMADPSPKVDLNPSSFPEVEFLELINTSTLAIPLSGIKLKVGDREYELPNYTLEADSLLVLSAQNTLEFWPSRLAVAGMDWSNSTLSNSGNSLALISPEGLIIEEFYYQQKWFNDPVKAEGGWSLERVNPFIGCHNSSNWKASNNSNGATPGESNSVAGNYLDTSEPHLLYFEIPQTNRIDLHFDRAFYLHDSNYFVSELSIDSLVNVSEHKHWAFFFNQDFQAGQIYHLRQRDTLYDCNAKSLWRDSLLFGLARKPESGELRISELLFNPASGQSDFIEICNRSDDFLDLADLACRAWYPEDNSLGMPFHFSDQHRILAPGEVLALSENPPALAEYYRADLRSIHEVPSLPSMGDAGCALVLVRRDLQELDSVLVEESFHASFLGNTEGISLFRIDYSEAALEENQWQSTPSAQAYATPGYADISSVKASDGQWTCSPKYISPNGDGYNDWISFHYSLEEAAWLQVWIYDRFGNLKKELCSGEWSPAEGQFLWKGEQEDGALSSGGLYIALLEFRYPSGKMGRHRLSFVISQ